jgi:hypothetical protein
MSKEIYAFSPIVISEDVDTEVAKNCFLNNIAENILNAMGDNYPEGDIDFAEVALDDHLEVYLQNPECHEIKHKMLLSLKEYLSGFFRNSEDSSHQIEVFVYSEDMEYSAFEFIIKEALQHRAFNLKELTVYGRTQPDCHSDIENAWEDRYSLNAKGDTTTEQTNWIA